MFSCELKSIHVIFNSCKHLETIKFQSSLKLMEPAKLCLKFKYNFKRKDIVLIKNASSYTSHKKIRDSVSQNCGTMEISAKFF